MQISFVVLSSTSTTTTVTEITKALAWALGCDASNILSVALTFTTRKRGLSGNHGEGRSLSSSVAVVAIVDIPSPAIAATVLSSLPYLSSTFSSAYKTSTGSTVTVSDVQTVDVTPTASPSLRPTPSPADSSASTTNIVAIAVGVGAAIICLAGGAFICWYYRSGKQSGELGAPDAASDDPLPGIRPLDERDLDEACGPDDAYSTDHRGRRGGMGGRNNRDNRDDSLPQDGGVTFKFTPEPSESGDGAEGGSFFQQRFSWLTWPTYSAASPAKDPLPARASMPTTPPTTTARRRVGGEPSVSKGNSRPGARFAAREMQGMGEVMAVEGSGEPTAGGSACFDQTDTIPAAEPLNSLAVGFVGGDDSDTDSESGDGPGWFERTFTAAHPLPSAKAGSGGGGDGFSAWLSNAAEGVERAFALPPAKPPRVDVGGAIIPPPPQVEGGGGVRKSKGKRGSSVRRTTDDVEF